ncbi:protein kinase domain-containing protein [Paractinoplanes deccanensis]|nr:protein kinase [Actinoplanes deccanensis]
MSRSSDPASTRPPISILAGRYRLRRPLGQGGMGRVWEARDELLGRDVALKEIAPDGLTTDELGDLRERAIREARAIAQISHPGVVRIFDVVEHEGTPWIVMELIRARSLFDVVHEDGPLEPARAARIGLDVLSALQAAHRAGILHRDVKPANILVGGNGRVVLTDFGLATAAGDAAMTRTGVMLGSPSYLAPERAHDEPASAKSDLWSLGATLFAAVEGKPPYQRVSPMTTLAALMVEPPAVPERAGILEPVLEALLEKDPAARADADEAAELLRYVLSEPVDTRAPTARPRRRRIGVLVALPVMAVAIAAAAIAATRSDQAPPAAVVLPAPSSDAPRATPGTPAPAPSLSAPRSVAASLPASAKPTSSRQTTPQPSRSPQAAAPTATPSAVKTATSAAPKPTAVSVTFEAESYTDNHGTEDSFPTEASGGRVVGKTDNGDWVGYANRSLAGVRKVSLRYAAGDGSTDIEIHAGSATGPRLARVTLTGTGNFQTYATVTTALSTTGSGAPYLVFLGPLASDIDVVTLA